MSKTVDKPNIKDLEKAFDGDLDLVLFFLTWVKNGRNASKAYLELNPHVDPASARVLGSRQLAKVNITAILETYGLGMEEYMVQLKAGLAATKRDHFSGEIEDDHKTRDLYHKRLGELLGLEKGGTALTQNNTENNYYNLTDEQLDQLINSKRRETGTLDVIEGEATQDSGEPA